MENKKCFSEKWPAVVCMILCFAAGFVLGTVFAPHHNRLEFNLFSGNGCENRENSASFQRPPRLRKDRSVT